MQYCNGGSLAEIIWHDGNLATPKEPLSTEQTWHFLLDILLGLQHLHRQAGLAKSFARQIISNAQISRFG